MIKIEKILKLCEKTIPCKIKDIGNLLRIKKNSFIFDVYSSPWNTNTTMYKLRIYKEGNPEPIKKFDYEEHNFEKDNYQGDKKVKDCFVTLQTKFIEWKDYQKELKEKEDKELKKRQKYEEEQKIKLEKEQRITDLEKLEKILK